MTEKDKDLVLFTNEEGSQEGKKKDPNIRFPASNLVKFIGIDIFAYGENIAELQTAKPKVNHKVTLDVFEKGNKRILKQLTSTEQITVELSNINLLKGSNKAAQKLFVLALAEANEQILYKGELIKGRDYITFPLKRLQEVGAYTTPQSARKGFRDGAKALMSISVSGTIQRAKEKNISVEGEQQLFTGYLRKDGQCFLFLNPRINWKNIARYFTQVPEYFFKLKNIKAALLLLLVSILSGQSSNVKSLKEKGYYTIRCRTLQLELGLPNESDTDNPKQDIRNILENAIDIIETTQSTAIAGDPQYKFEWVYKDETKDVTKVTNTTEWLDNCYLKVIPVGANRDYFLARSKKLKSPEKKK